MNYYPFTTPQILTDAIYTQYGGHTDNTMLSQRQAAYAIAEEAVCRDLDTFLVPTIVTGSYAFTSTRFPLDHAHVNRVILTRFYDFDDTIYHTVSGTGNWYVNIYDTERGIFDINALWSIYCVPVYNYLPYKVEVVYETGFASGTSYSPNILMALTTYADIVMNEMIGYGNEAPGAVGVTDFTNQQYSETRVKFFDTAYGTSARAQFVHKLLGSFRKLRYVGRR